MLHIVKKVEYLKARNMFIPLKDIEHFKRVECDGKTICWPNGVDLCPDVLYKIGKPIKVSKSKTSRLKSVSTSRKKSKVKAS